jgi:uncharacterized damage-inducible protein DinB
MAAANSELTVLQEHLGRYRKVTLQTLDLMPEDKLSWRPLGDQRTAGEQFLHIAQTEEFYARGLFENEWNMDRLKPEAITQSRAMLQQRLASVRAYVLGQFGRLTAEQLDAVANVPGIPVSWPLRSWLWYLVEHEVHHKAQLALYLRQLGIVPPFFAYALPPGVRPDIR